MQDNEYTFFLIVPPGLEELARLELLEKWERFIPDHPPPEIKIEHGGFEITLPLLTGCMLNTFLKIPTRVLLRLDEFKCRDFPKLFNKLKKIPWRKFLLGQTPKLKSTSIQSRVFDSSRIEKCFNDAITNYYEANAPKKAQLENLKTKDLPPSIVYLRIENDNCIVSIDTSGDRLNVRSYRKAIGLAPIRENIAAALTYKLKMNVEFNEDIVLIDPMCGSGTFLLESVQFHSTNISRDYSFRGFPIMKNFQIQLPESLESPPLFHRHIGYDHDEKVLEAAVANRENANISEEMVKFSEKDLFDSNNKLSVEEKIVLIANPPYGKRLVRHEEIFSYFQKIIERIEKVYSPSLFGVVVPDNINLKKLKTSKEYSAHKTTAFKNGGLKVNFAIWKKGEQTDTTS